MLPGFLTLLGMALSYQTTAQQNSWLYSQILLIWCRMLETQEDWADGAEGVSGLVVGSGRSDGSAKSRGRGGFGRPAGWGGLFCGDRTGHWRRSPLPAL